MFTAFLKNQLKVLILMGVIFVAYAPSFINQFVWDDEQFIQENEYTKSLLYIDKIFTTNIIEGAGHQSNYYRPLTTISFTIDRMIWGLRPLGFHLTNTVLHIIAAVILYKLLSRLGLPEYMSWWTAMVFGVHPIQTEAVVYMNSRGDSLYAMWLLASFWCAVSGLKKSKNQAHTRPRWIWLGLSVTSFILALLSKEIAIAGLAVAVAIGMRYQQQWKWVSGWLVSLGLVAAMYMGLRLTVLNFGNTLNLYETQNVYTESIVVRLSTFARVLAEYARLIVWPYPLHMERDVPIYLTPFTIWGGLVLVAGLVWMGLCWYEWQKRKSGWILFGGWWTASMLAPVSGIIPINGLLYEHWLYVPLIGVCVAIAGMTLLMRDTRWYFHRAKSIDKTLRIFLGVMVGVYVLLTIRQNWIWRSPLSLYPYLLQYVETPRIHNNLAMAYSDVNNYQKAIEHYQAAITLGDFYPQTHYNLALTYGEMGEIASCEAELRAAIAKSPRFDIARVTLLQLLVLLERHEEVVTLSQELSRDYPEVIDYVEAEIRAHMALEKKPDAEMALKAALKKWPKSGKLLLLQKQLQ